MADGPSVAGRWSQAAACGDGGAHGAVSLGPRQGCGICDALEKAREKGHWDEPWTTN